MNHFTRISCATLLGCCLSLGVCFADTNATEADKTNELIAHYGTMISSNPDNFSALRSRALLYSQSLQFDKAVRDYTEAIRVMPAAADMYLNRGNAYIELKQYAKAVADFNKAIACNPQYKEAYHGRYLAFKALGMTEAANGDMAQYTEMLKPLISAPGELPAS